MRLDELNRARCRFHLGFGNRGQIPAADVAVLELGMDTIDGNYQYNRIKEILDSCDDLWSKWRRVDIESQASKELISGDINRSVIRTIDPKAARKLAWSNYLEMVQELAQNLSCANYRDDYYQRYRFERGAGDYLNIVPGVADTAVGSAQYEISRNGGGFGMPVF